MKLILRLNAPTKESVIAKLENANVTRITMVSHASVLSALRIAPDADFAQPNINLPKMLTPLTTTELGISSSTLDASVILDTVVQTAPFRNALLELIFYLDTDLPKDVIAPVVDSVITLKVCASASLVTSVPSARVRPSLVKQIVSRRRRKKYFPFLLQG